MSHYTVLVIGGDVEGQLAPFNEELAVEPYIDSEAPADHWYAHATREAFGLDEDAPVTAEQIVETYNRKYILSATTKGQLALPVASVVGEPTDPYAPWTLPSPERARKMAEGIDEEVLFVHEGQVACWSTSNPRGKWDWFSVGGRWTGFWLLTSEGAALLGMKDDEAPFVGHAGFMTPGPDAGHADSALRRHIDLDGMRADAEAEARKTWADYATLVGPVIDQHGIGESWDAVFLRVTGQPTGVGGVDQDLVDQARREYHDQPYIRALWGHEDFRWHDGPHDHFGPDLSEASAEAFAQRARDKAGVPYAVVRNGEWHAKGEMGWFGMSRNERTQSEWNALVAALLDTLDPDERLTLVDCHV